MAGGAEVQSYSYGSRIFLLQLTRNMLVTTTLVKTSVVGVVAMNRWLTTTQPPPPSPCASHKQRNMTTCQSQRLYIQPWTGASAFPKHSVLIVEVRHEHVHGAHLLVALTRSAGPYWNSAVSCKDGHKVWTENSLGHGTYVQAASPLGHDP